MSTDAVFRSRRRLFRVWAGVVMTGFYILAYMVGMDYALGQGIPGELIHILLKQKFPFQDVLIEGAPAYSQLQLDRLDQAEQQAVSQGVFWLTGGNMADAQTMFLSYFTLPAQSAGLGWTTNPQNLKSEVSQPLPENSSQVPVQGGSVTQPGYRSQASSNHAKDTVVIDPGHGGIDPGAQVPYLAVAQADVSSDGGKLDEKTITLAVALQLEKILNSQGINVIMTRSTDIPVSLAERAEISNNSGARIYVSIHCNWVSNPSVTGVLGTYFENSVAPYTNHVSDTIDPLATDNWPLSKDLARKIAYSVAAKTGQSVFGLQAQPYEVLRLNDLPSTLVELGFMTNPATAEAMETLTWQKQAAAGIAKGISSYFASHSAVPATPSDKKSAQ